MKRLRIGLVSGRHPMPVTRFLLRAKDIDPAPGNVYELERMILRRVREENLHAELQLDLYLTGLTRAALIAVELLRWMRIDCRVMEYDRKIGEWIHTITIQPPAGSYATSMTLSTRIYPKALLTGVLSAEIGRQAAGTEWTLVAER